MSILKFIKRKIIEFLFDKNSEKIIEEVLLNYKANTGIDLDLEFYGIKTNKSGKNK